MNLLAPEASVSRDAFSDLMTMNGGARVFGQACSNGLLKALSLKAGTAKELAGRCKLAEQPVELVMEILVELGVVDRRRDTYGLSPLMQMVRHGYGDLGNTAWSHLPAWLQGAEPYQDSDFREAESTRLQQVLTLGWMMKPSANLLAAEILHQTQGYVASILDVYAGTGIWSLRLAAQLPEAKVTLMDHPNLSGLGCLQVEALGLSDRVQSVCSDVLELELPPDAYDVIFLANLLHAHSEETNISIFRRCARALRSGGQLVVVDVMPGHREGNLARRLYELGLALRSPQGKVHTPDRLQANLRSAGLQASNVFPIDAPPHTMGALFAGRFI